MRKRVLAVILAVCLVAQGAGVSAEEAAVSGNDISAEDSETRETESETPTDTSSGAGNETQPESTDEGGEGETELESVGYTETEQESVTETETETETAAETETLMLQEEGIANVTEFTACSPQELADGLNHGSGVNCAILSDNKVTLLADIVVNGGGYIDYQAGIVTGLILDLNGRSITADSDVTALMVSNVSHAADAVTIQGGSITNRDHAGVQVMAPSTRVTLSGVQIQGGKYGVILREGEVTLEGGACQGGVTGFQRLHGSKLTINGGVIKGVTAYGLEVPSTYDGVELNGGIYSGGTNSYKGTSYKLSEFLGTGKTAYHYDAGSRGTKFTSAELARNEIDSAFEIAEGETGLTGINGSVNVTGHDESTSTISLNSMTAEGIGFIGTVRADGTYFLAGVSDGEYSIGLLLDEPSALNALKLYGFAVRDGAVVPAGAEHIVLGNARLSGTAAYDDGTPAGGVTVRLVNSRNSGIWYENGSIAAGSYAIPHVPAGQYTAELTLPGGERAACMIEMKDGENAWNVVFPRSAAGGTLITGSVKDPAGNPVAGATVSIAENSGGYSMEVLSDAGGRFQAAGLVNGTYTITARKDGLPGSGVAGCTLTDGKITAGTANVMIGKGIYGHVMTEDGAPYAGAEVIIKNQATGEQHSTTVQAGGKFILEAAAMGMYDVTIKKDGLEVCIKNLLINDEAVTRDWTVGTATLEGVVRDGDARPLNGISVLASGGVYGYNYMTPGITTGADGSYKISGLPAGHYTVYAKPEGGPGVSREIDIGKGENALCSFIFGNGSGAAAGSAAGIVTDGTGAALGGITVVYKNKGGGAVHQAVTGADGKYKIDVLPNGDYDVLLIGPGLNMAAGQVVMNSGTPSGPTSFVIGTSGIKGFIKGSMDEAVQGAWVSLKNKATGNVYYAAAVSGADGSYEIMGVPAGEYIVTVKASGKNDAVENIIISSSVLNKNFVMLPSSGSGGAGGSPGGNGSSPGAGGSPGGNGGNSGAGGSPGGNGGNSGAEGSPGGNGGNSGAGGSPGGNGSGPGAGGSPGGNGGNSGAGGSPGGNGSSPGAGIPGGSNQAPGGEAGFVGNSTVVGSIPVTAGGNNALTAGQAAGNSIAPRADAGTTGAENAAGRQTASGAFSQTAPPQEAGSSGSVSRPKVSPTVAESPAGTIKGGLSGGNIEEADVTLTDKQSGKIFREKTDKQGSYYFKDIPDGSYSIRITTKDGTVLAADFLFKDGAHTLSIAGFRVFAAGEKEPKTGDAVPAAVSVALIGGLAYLTELFCDKKDIQLGITRAQKDRLVDKIVVFARKRNKFIRYIAMGVIFILLVFYYSLGRIVETDAGELVHA